MAETITTQDPATANPDDLFLELGTTGLRQFGGFVREEFLPVLSGQRGARTYREMRDNDAIIGAALYALEMLVRRVAWEIHPVDTSPQAQQYADLVSGMLFQDMAQSWSILVSDILSFLPFGWAYHEIVYKRRLGEQPAHNASNLASSRFNDGLIGWRKMPIRAQDTLLRWDYTPERSLAGMIQQDVQAARTVGIPIQKALLFRAFSWKENPEGRSILRNAYRSWYNKTRIENIEGIGVERDLAGLPVIWAPSDLFQAQLTANQQAQMTAFKRIVRNIRMDEQSGIIMPLEYDDNNNKLYNLELLSTGGSRQFDTSKIIDRYDTRILQSVMADVIMVGQHGSGSYNLAETKSELLTMAITGICEAITEPFNRYAIPRLGELNGWPQELLPSLAHGETHQVDFERFTRGILNLAQAGFMLTSTDESYIRREINFPALMEGDA